METPFVSPTEQPTADGDRIFESKAPFSDSYVPDEILGRDDVIEQYTSALQDVVDGFGPRNIFVYGDSGVGKTTVTMKMMELLQEEVESLEMELTVLTVNCAKYDTSYQVQLHIANQLSDDQFQQGDHPAELWNTITTTISDDEDQVIVVLDEVDRLGRDTSVWSDFLKSTTHGVATQVGLIGISRTDAYLDELDRDIQYDVTPIQFGIYGSTNLQTILDYYAEKALADGAFEHDVIPYCAAIAAQETGTARTALQLLRFAGEQARDSNAPQITTDHVDQARSTIGRVETAKVLTDELTPHQQLLVLITAVYEDREEEAISYEHLYELYQERCSGRNMEPVSERRALTLAKNIEEKGLLKSQMCNTGSQGGRWREYSTLGSPREILQIADKAETAFKYLIPDDI